MTTRASTSSSTSDGAGTRVVSFGTGTGASSGGGGVTPHGQPMPFTPRQVYEAWRVSRKVGGGYTATTREATLNGHRYIIKSHEEQNTEYQDLPHITDRAQARNEEVTVAALRELGWSDLGPREAYHVRGRDLGIPGEFAVISKETGTADNMGHSAEIVGRVGREQLERAWLAEYALGMQDRHAGNMLYDARTGTVREIDFGYSFKRYAYIEGRSAVGQLLRQQARAAGEDSPELSRAAVQHVIATAPRILATMRQYKMSEAQQRAFRQRIGVLRDAVRYSHGEPITFELIQSEIDSHGYRLGPPYESAFGR